MVICPVPECGKSCDTGSFPLPRNNLLQKWAEILQLKKDIVRPSTRICKCHFDESLIVGLGTKNETLKPQAVPTKNLPKGQKKGVRKKVTKTVVRTRANEVFVITEVDQNLQGSVANHILNNNVAQEPSTNSVAATPKPHISPVSAIAKLPTSQPKTFLKNSILITDSGIRRATKYGTPSPDKPTPTGSPISTPQSSPSPTSTPQLMISAVRSMNPNGQNLGFGKNPLNQLKKIPQIPEIKKIAPRVIKPASVMTLQGSSPPNNGKIEEPAATSSDPATKKPAALIRTMQSKPLVHYIRESSASRTQTEGSANSVANKKESTPGTSESPAPAKKKVVTICVPNSKRRIIRFIKDGKTFIKFLDDNSPGKSTTDPSKKDKVLIKENDKPGQEKTAQFNPKEVEKTVPYSTISPIVINKKCTKVIPKRRLSEYIEELEAKVPEKVPEKVPLGNTAGSPKKRVVKIIRHKFSGEMLKVPKMVTPHPILNSIKKMKLENGKNGEETNGNSGKILKRAENAGANLEKSRESAGNLKISEKLSENLKKPVENCKESGEKLEESEKSGGKLKEPEENSGNSEEKSRKTGEKLEKSGEISRKLVKPGRTSEISKEIPQKSQKIVAKLVKPEIADESESTSETSEENLENPGESSRKLEDKLGKNIGRMWQIPANKTMKETGTLKRELESSDSDESLQKIKKAKEVPGEQETVREDRLKRIREIQRNLKRTKLAQERTLQPAEEEKKSPELARLKYLEEQKKKKKFSSCGLCKSVFPIPRQLEVHRKIHHPEGEHIEPLECDICDEPFLPDEAGKLKFHKYWSHPNGKRLHCKFCKLDYLNYLDYFKHIANHSNNVCHICGSFFDSGFDLKTHRRQHIKINFNLTCICGRGFVNLEFLKRHQQQCDSFKEQENDKKSGEPLNSST